MLEASLRQVAEGQDLDARQAEQALDRILADETDEVQIESLLIALADKGESVDEIAGFARGMRRHALAFESPRQDLVDTAGTGGGRDTFNVSTTAAFVIAAAGAAVAKHGNRAVTSRCGSADLLEQLGVPIEVQPEEAAQMLDRHGFSFFFAQIYHPAMRRVAQIRRRLGRRTIFNLLGPLTNPAGAPFQLIGVFEPQRTRPMAEALAQLGCGRAWVVHAHDGLDEISAQSPTRVSEVREGQVRTFDFDPREWGFHAAESPAKGGSPEENARLTREILAGGIRGAARDIVLLNAAAALHLIGEDDFAAALEKARQALDSGAAYETLEALSSPTADD